MQWQPHINTEAESSLSPLNFNQQPNTVTNGPRPSYIPSVLPQDFLFVRTLVKFTWITVLITTYRTWEVRWVHHLSQHKLFTALLRNSVDLARGDKMKLSRKIRQFPAICVTNTTVIRTFLVSSTLLALNRRS